MQDVTCIIKTYERPQHLDRLIKSIRRFYPDMKIIVADDGEGNREDVEYHKLPHDVGLSAGRNFLVSKVKTKYFVLLDDDFIFTPETDLVKLREVLKTTDIDIIGGRLYEIGCYTDYSGTFKVEGKTVTYDRTPHENFGKYRTVDIIFNFFMAKTKSFKGIGWDNDLKLAEHFDFFWNIRGKRKVAIMPKVAIEHQPFDIKTTDNYKEKRKRARSYFKYLLEKNNLEKVINYEGNVIID